MSGGGALGGGPKIKRGKNSKRKPKKRLGFHVDMTPMVDITFLLLTFFMFTTTMASPQVMEMSVPPEMKTQIDVPESLLLQIYVRDDGKLFYAKASDDPAPLDMKKLRDLAIRENLRPDTKNKLITALKCSENASYGLVVNILDELNVAETTITAEVGKDKDAEGKPTKRERRFTIAPLTEDEIAKLKGL